MLGAGAIFKIMEITDVKLSIWINPKMGGTQFNSCNEAEELLKEITALIKERGYKMKDEMCGKNPEIAIFKS